MIILYLKIGSVWGEDERCLHLGSVSCAYQGMHVAEWDMLRMWVEFVMVFRYMMYCNLEHVNEWIYRDENDIGL